MYSLTRRLATSQIEVSELLGSVRQCEAELQHLYQSLVESYRYSATAFLPCQRQARLLMVHQSWHHAHCDLYRIFLTGYREAAPLSALQGIDNREILQKRSSCLKHAQSIIQILEDFSEQCKIQVIDFDTAVCAYHSIRIILFTAQTGITGQNLNMAAALEKARFCQATMHRFFPKSPVVEPMVRLQRSS